MSTEVTRRDILQMAMMPALLTQLRVGDMPPTVSKVYPGPDGRLVYVPDDKGNIIHDTSHAGYRGGGVPIPTVPVKDTIWPVPGDNTAHVQAAIDRVSALPLDRSGLRGAVLLKAGIYRMATPVTIRASGVVLRGEGMGDTGTILVGTGTGRPAAPAAAPPAAAPAGQADPGTAAPAAPGGRGAGPGVRGAGPGPGGAQAPPGAASGRGGGRGGFGGGAGPATLIRIAGSSGVTTQDDTKQLVIDEYVPVGTLRIWIGTLGAWNSPRPPPLRSLPT
jgi:hypothetical protein